MKTLKKIGGWLFDDLVMKKFFCEEKMREFPPTPLTKEQLRWLNEPKHLKTLKDWLEK